MKVKIVGEGGPKEFILKDVDPGDLVRILDTAGYERDVFIVTDYVEDYYSETENRYNDQEMVSVVNVRTGQLLTFGFGTPCYIYDEPEIMVSNFVTNDVTNDQKSAKNGQN